jgi:hypothetical protein
LLLITTLTADNHLKIKRPRGNCASRSFILPEKVGNRKIANGKWQVKMPDARGQRRAKWQVANVGTALLIVKMPDASSQMPVASQGAINLIKE